MPRRDLENGNRLVAALNSLEVRPSGAEAPVELEGADFLGWQAQRFETVAGPLDVVPHAAAIGAYEDVATVGLALGDLTIRAITIDEVIVSEEELGRPKDIAALPALDAARGALRQRRSGTDEEA